MINPKTFDEVSQISHVGWGCLAITLPYALGLPLDDTLSLVPVFLGIAAWKEFYWDLNHEDPDVRGSSLRDFLFYCVGIFSAGFLLFFRYRVFSSII